tara:strand:- start:9939 stop:10247 length:309 start_codon:yes stop_codon:yes gene_type:complete
MKALLKTIAPLVLTVFASTSFAATEVKCRNITHGTSVKTFYCCHITKLNKLWWVDSEGFCKSLGGEPADNCNTFTKLRDHNVNPVTYCRVDKDGAIPKFFTR